MCELPQDEPHLQSALALAQAAVGLASPNPTVGCVLVRDGAVLGQGAHAYQHRDHAEIVALKAAALAGRDVRGATAYVTLEPCAHHGRTGPCADALVHAGIARCVAATVDPNPLVRGQGFQKLRTAGLDVVIAQPASAAAQKARRLNDAFAFAVQHGRPLVTLKAALSVDGMLAPAPGTRIAGQPHWLTGPAARADVQRLRHAADAIVTGIGTVLADDPMLTDRSGLPRRVPLLRVVLDSSLRTPPGSAVVRSAAADVLVVGRSAFTLPSDQAERYAARKRALEEAGVEVIELAPEVTGSILPLQQVLRLLATREVRGVLLEAGSALNGSFLREQLVDQAILYYAEAELGVGSVPFATGFGSPYARQAELTRTDRKSFPNGGTEDIRVSGYLHDPWAGVDAASDAR